MPKDTTNITDTELIQKLEESYIGEAQKKELEALIPEMDDTQKTKLINLIEQSKIEYEKAQKEYQKGLQAISNEYSETLKKEDKKFRTEFEQLGKEEDAAELKEVEAEIAAVNPTETRKETKKTETTKKQKHTFRNLFIILIFLILIAIAAIYGLKNL